MKGTETIVEHEAVRRGRAPSISVVMPLRNAMPFLDESIASILNQTFGDFEFIILDDASTDDSRERLYEWAARDDRIRLYVAREQLGLSRSSSFVVRQARAALVARMDADDISHPERLMRQWEVMRDHSDVALLGTLFEGIDEEGRRVRARDRWRLARKSLFPPFPHGSVMFRREIYEEVGGYRTLCERWEDQDLFLRMRRRAMAMVLAEVLYYYRFHIDNSMSNGSLERAIGAYQVRQLCLQELARGHDYTQLLTDARPNGRSTEAVAYALYLRGIMRLWAGYQPEVHRLLLKYRPLGIGPLHLKLLVCATWGWLSPKSLRFLLRSFLRTRDLLASYSVKDGGIHEWRLE